METPGITYREIKIRDNKELAELIRSVFREFGIDRPGTVYFDPTTDDLSGLFSNPGSVYECEENGRMMVLQCIYARIADGCAGNFLSSAPWRGVSAGRSWRNISNQPNSLIQAALSGIAAEPKSCLMYIRSVSYIPHAWATQASAVSGYKGL
jgi:hypothetical protein